MASELRQRPTTIRLHVDTAALPSAHQIGTIFEALVRVFNQLDGVRGKRGRARPKLRISGVELGSFWADFWVIGEKVLIVAGLGYLAEDLVRRLHMALKAIVEDSPEKLTKAEQTAIESIAAPILEDGAKEASLRIDGANEPDLNIVVDYDIALRIREYRRPSRPRIAASVGTAAGSSTAKAVGQTVHRLQAKDLVTSPPAVGRPSLQVQDASSRTQAENVRLGSWENGIAHYVKGQWYVRPKLKGFETLLLPVRNPYWLKGLSKDQLHEVVGSIISHEGRPLAFSIQGPYSIERRKNLR
jgi:hypothetical protein